jgi:hypothetical protein
MAEFTVAVIAIIVAAAIAGGCSHDCTTRSFQDEAVAKGKAEYYLDDKHQRQWQWKP